MMQEQEDLLKAYGWSVIESKNSYMFSFIKEDMRLNFYQSGTVTIQGYGRKIKVKREVFSANKLEILILNIWP